MNCHTCPTSYLQQTKSNCSIDQGKPNNPKARSSLAGTGTCLGSSPARFYQCCQSLDLVHQKMNFCEEIVLLVKGWVSTRLETFLPSQSSVRGDHHPRLGKPASINHSESVQHLFTSLLILLLAKLESSQHYLLRLKSLWNNAMVPPKMSRVTHKLSQDQRLVKVLSFQECLRGLHFARSRWKLVYQC